MGGTAQQRRMLSAQERQSAYSKALQRMIDEGRLSVSGAIQSSFGGQVFRR